MRRIAAVAVGLSCAALVACSGLSVQDSVDPVELIKLRAGERWGFMVQGRLDDAYVYMSPLVRQTISLEKYKSTIRPGLWESAAVEKVECGTDDVCTVSVKIRYAAPVGRIGGVFHGSTVISERWRKYEQQWWFVPDR